MRVSCNPWIYYDLNRNVYSEGDIAAPTAAFQNLLRNDIVTLVGVGVSLGVQKMDDIAFPDIAKMEELFRRLPVASRRRAEEEARSAMSQFDRGSEFRASLQTLREVGNKFLLQGLLASCDDPSFQALCREAFGLSGNQFRPGPLQRPPNPKSGAGNDGLPVNAARRLP
jgi:hypothetical protein